MVAETSRFRGIDSAQVVWNVAVGNDAEGRERASLVVGDHDGGLTLTGEPESIVTMLQLAASLVLRERDARRADARAGACWICGRAVTADEAGISRRVVMGGRLYEQHDVCAESAS